MSISRVKVQLFYDVISPYTWFAFEVLCRYKPVWKSMDLELKPFYLGGIMKETGNKPPMLVPNKAIYMYSDLSLNSKYFDVPLQPPSDPAAMILEKGSLKAQRFLTSVQLQAPSYLEEVSRQLWMRTWNSDQDITTLESLAATGEKAKMASVDIENCLKAIDSALVKQSLKEATEEALNHGAFGSPTIVAHLPDGPAMLFGSDRFPLLAMLLNEEWKGPVPNGGRL